MLPVWFFSALLLSSVLGHPIDRNDTRNGTRTVFSDCPLSTCSIHDLDWKLRPGDENAGGDASSPHGPGKK